MEAESKIDALRRVETPEGIELQLRSAGLIVRALAWTVDCVIKGSVLAVAAIFLNVIGDFGSGLYLILFFVMEWFYPVLFEVFGQGATPGKKRFGLRVVHDDGTPISWSRSIIRNFLRFADFLPVAYGAGIVSMLLNRDFKRLGDLAAGTIVVYRSVADDKHLASKQKAKARADLNSASADVARAPQFPLSTAEQRLIISWAERRALLSEGRQFELANLLEPLTGLEDEDAAQALSEIAHWSMGVPVADVGGGQGADS